MIFVECAKTGKVYEIEYCINVCRLCDITMSTKISNHIPVISVLGCMRKEFLKRYCANFRTLTVKSDQFDRFAYGYSVHNKFAQSNSYLGEFEKPLSLPMGDYCIVGVADVVTGCTVIELKTSQFSTDHLVQASIYSHMTGLPAEVWYLDSKAQVRERIIVPKIKGVMERFEKVKDAWILIRPDLLPPPVKSRMCLNCYPEVYYECFGEPSPGLHKE